ncbi:SpoIID/LytB domain-containing protein [Lachnotalea glycerini]|uniref:SpoIID/LytB domain-containing protein n=1 Tax=Lachnotalea glycerini TaxID=1763509 RepID=A0A371JJ15_9FIRM|nr:SpoIID/LytB domain-containing protein [Lachnotalea glycerini]RDY32707.1 SpoIID/LytB domain-containing protein [Lachnotalea glycerini]
MANKYRLKIKAVLIIVGIILLGTIVVTSISTKEKQNDKAKAIRIEEAADMLIFTGHDATWWTDFLGKADDDFLTYKDITAILDNLGILSDESKEYSEVRANKRFKKEEWLTLYDKIVEQLDTNNKVTYQDVFVLADNGNCESLSENEIYTDKGIYEWKNSKALNECLYRNCKVIVYDSHIIYVVENYEEEYRLNNIYIVSGDENGINIFTNGKYINYNNRPLDNNLSSEIGDILFEDGEIKEIKVKGDKISGKLLSIQADSLEIEEYGFVPLDENFRLFKEYGKLEELSINDLLVGYNVTDFIVADGKISAGLVMKDLVVENIRVLIKSSNFESLFHNNVMLESNSDYTIYYGEKLEKQEKHAADEDVSIDESSNLWESSRIKIEPDTLSGKMTLLSVQRASGNPSYLGTIEIVKDSNGLIVINEVSMEEYLYKVVPSEMPESFGIEALKAQAVCARTYAYNHILDNAYAQYGAQVDDSVSFQVYSNQEETPACTQSVKETYGQVLVKDDNVIDTFYFSTSCGHTTNSAIWVEQSEKDRSYLQPKFIGLEDCDLDLTDEAVFYDFITKNEYDGFESEEPWYRWTTTIPVDTLSNTLNSRLAVRYQANPELILVKNKNGEFESKEISDIGMIKDITVINRNEGGILNTIVIEGSKATIKVITEYNIRYLLAPVSTQITKADGSVIESFSLLPSAYCIFDKVMDDKKLTDIKFTGGGYGHGVGMSQNGAKIMAANQYTYDEILKYFYEGVDLINIY